MSPIRSFVCLTFCSASLWAHAASAAFFPIAEHGPSSNRVNAFFLGDGYTAAEIASGKYSTHVMNYVSYMFANNINSDPYFRYRNFFNLYRVDVVSNESGADEPQNNVTKDTALDATYRYDGTTDRLLYINSTKANAALNAALAGSGKTAQMRFVSVNSTIYGGGGASGSSGYAVFAGGNSSAREIALHELSHSFSNLADEYGGFTGPYPGSEPASVNVTKDSTGAKWSRWIGYNDPSGGVVGAYEGGAFYDQGIYRPTTNSKMRTLGRPFNAISREKIILDIYNRVDPLDSFTANTLTLNDPLSLSVARIDSAVIDTEWFVDGIRIEQLNGDGSIDIPSLGLNSGNHTLKVRAFDPTGFDPVNGWVRMSSNQLEQFVSWNIVVDLLRGDFNRSGSFDAADIAPLLRSLTDLDHFKSENGLTDSDLLFLGDFNSDGVFSNRDIQPCLDLLGSQSPSLMAAVPEPHTSLSLFSGGLFFALVRFVKGKQRAPYQGEVDSIVRLQPKSSI